MEGVRVLERTDEHGHLGNEAAQARKTEVGETGNHIAYAEERHDFHQSAHLTDVTGVGTSVNHTDEGKEEGGHQTVAQHLQDGTRAARAGHHQQGEEHQTAV